MKPELLQQLKDELHRLNLEKQRIENDMLRIQRFVRECEGPRLQEGQSAPSHRGQLRKLITKAMSESSEEWFLPRGVTESVGRSGYAPRGRTPLPSRVSNELGQMLKQGIVERLDGSYRLKRKGVEV